jgi:hypothetical protein
VSEPAHSAATESQTDTFGLKNVFHVTRLSH